MTLIELIKRLFLSGCYTDDEKELIKFLKTATPEEKEEIRRILEEGKNDN